MQISKFQEPQTLVIIHCREEGCFPAISRAEGCKIPAEANLEVRGRRIFQFIPTRGSVLTFFVYRKKHALGSVLENTRPRECIGNYTQIAG